MSPNILTTPDKANDARQISLNTWDFLRVIYRAVLLGNPGGGKTTLVSKLCYDLASNYSERLFAGRQVTPILVVLRDYGSQKKPHNCSILQFIETTANSRYQVLPPKGAFDSSLALQLINQDFRFAGLGRGAMNRAPTFRFSAGCAHYRSESPVNIPLSASYRSEPQVQYEKHLHNLKHIGRILVSSPPPWVHGNLLKRTDFMHPFWYNEGYFRDKQSRVLPTLDPDSLFSIFALLAVFLEANDIQKSRIPIFNSMSGLYQSRFQQGASDEIQSNLDLLDFTTEQQTFVHRWRGFR